MTDRELIQQALDVLETKERFWASYRYEAIENIQATITALRGRLAQPEQEPVAWANSNDLQNFDMRVRTNGGPLHTVPLYTTPPQRKPLTDEELDYWIGSNSTKKALCRAIEAAHGIKP